MAHRFFTPWRRGRRVEEPRSPTETNAASALPRADADDAYDAAVAWLLGRQALGVKLGLEKMERLLANMAVASDGPLIVHIAGTNGKGSVAAMMAATLQGAGYKVGLTTSPHLTRFTERVRVDGTEIPRADVAIGVDILREAVAELDAAGQPPTFFECVTALALWWFQRSQCTAIVVETGMGGRLDATNVMSPDVSIITNVGIDHQAYLGDDIRDIAFEKAGILKPQVPCVTGATGPALEVLRLQANAVNAPLHPLSDDYSIVPTIGGMLLVTPHGEARYEVAAAGEHQLHNAALVVAAVQALRDNGHDIPHGALGRGLQATVVPGRLESMSHEAPDGRLVNVLLDGAHNDDAANALRKHFANSDLFGFHLIVGFMADKVWQPCLDAWWPVAAHVHVVPLRSPRGADPAAIAAHLDGEWVPVTVHSDVASALDAAALAGASHVVVAGSLFLVGEARAILAGESLEEIKGVQ